MHGVSIFLGQRLRIHRRGLGRLTQHVQCHLPCMTPYLRQCVYRMGRRLPAADAAFNFSALYSEKLKKQLDKVIITDAEKDKYITSILSEQPIFLDVTYAKLRDISFTFRSKFVYEQEYIAKFIKDTLLSEKGKSMTPDEMCIFIFKTNVAIILHQVNNVDFFKKKLPINLTDIISYEEFTGIISARIDQLSKLGQQFWSLIVNAACVFEKKEQLLAEFFVNEDF